jgi:hypothetical protein
VYYINTGVGMCLPTPERGPSLPPEALRPLISFPGGIADVAVELDSTASCGRRDTLAANHVYEVSFLICSAR